MNVRMFRDFTAYRIDDLLIVVRPDGTGKIRTLGSRKTSEHDADGIKRAFNILNLPNSVKVRLWGN